MLTRRLEVADDRVGELEDTRKKIIEKNIKIIIVTSKTYIICVYMCVCYVCIYIYK